MKKYKSKVYVVSYSKLSKNDLEHVIDYIKKYNAPKWKEDIDCICRQLKLPRFDALRYYVRTEYKETPKLFGGVKKIGISDIDIYFEFAKPISPLAHRMWTIMIKSYMKGSK